jgi:osmoprotectant transport system ATP-binding protein
MTGKAEDNLRVVLSRLYESNTSWMPIVDEDGRYNGEISGLYCRVPEFRSYASGAEYS